jgi:hypothetical protein
MTGPEFLVRSASAAGMSESRDVIRSLRVAEIAFKGVARHDEALVFLDTPEPDSMAWHCDYLGGSFGGLTADT